MLNKWVSAALAAVAMALLLPAPPAQAQRHGRDFVTELQAENMKLAASGGYSYGRRWDENNRRWGHRGYTRGRQQPRDSYGRRDYPYPAEYGNRGGHRIGHNGTQNAWQAANLAVGLWGALEARGARRAAQRMERGDEQGGGNWEGSSQTQIVIIGSGNTNPTGDGDRTGGVGAASGVRYTLVNTTGCEVALHQYQRALGVLAPGGTMSLSSLNNIEVTGNFGGQVLFAKTTITTTEEGDLRLVIQDPRG